MIEIGEAFLECGKPDDQLDVMARDAAILLSIALQYGVPLDVLAHAVKRNSNGQAAGPIGAMTDLLKREAAR
jgi:hypothetical protein